MQHLIRDLRFSLRILRKRPAFTALAVATLALGIGANATLFSVVKSVLLAPLPYENSDRLMRVFDTNPAKSLFHEDASSANIVDWRRRTDSFEGIAGWYVMGRTMRGDAGAQVVSVAQVSTDFFPILRTQALLGRTFTEEETDRATFNRASAPTGTDPVIVLSHRIWRQQFGADPDVVGKMLSLERRQWKIVGVMPAAFAMPDPGVDVWIPWSFLGDRPRGAHFLGAAVRLAPGVTLPQAQAELSAVAAELGKIYPETNEGWGVRLVPLRDDMVQSSRQALLVLLGAVAFVLLIACVNVANFQLARAGERRREVAVRMALGASRAHLVRQFLVENLLLSFAGGGVGVLMAFWSVELLKRWGPGGIPRLEEVSLDAMVLGFTFLLSLLTGMVFGMAPALEGTRTDVASNLKEEGSRGSTAGRGRRRLRQALVVSEIAVALLLLVGAGLLLQSFANLRRVDPGFDAENVLVLPIFLNNQAYDSGEKTRGYYAALMESLEALPGVVKAGGATALPASPLGPDFDRPFWAEGESPVPGGGERADIRMATPGYFETLGLKILSGRAFRPEDRPDSTRVLLVNETLARRTWAGEDPVGKRLVVDYGSAGIYPYEVVGVVGDVRFYGPRSKPRPEVYFPHAQRSYLILNVAVRTSVDPASLIPQVRRAVFEVDPDQPAHSILPLTTLLGNTVRQDRFSMLLLAGFAVVALLLAVMGIYGLLSYLVHQRTAEIGIRMALGAGSRDIFSMILYQGGTMALIGVAGGLAGSLLLTRLLSSLLFGVSPMDPSTVVTVSLALMGTALIACFVPARRATRVDVMEALRTD